MSTLWSGAFGYALISAVLWGTGATIEKVAMRGGDAMGGVFIRSVMACVASGIFFSVTSGGWSAVTKNPPLSVTLFCLTGFTSMMVGQAFFFKALKLGEASRIVPISGTYPLIAAVLSIVFLGEPLSVRKSIAVLLIVGGVALLR